MQPRRQAAHRLLPTVEFLEGRSLPSTSNLSSLVPTDSVPPPEQSPTREAISPAPAPDEGAVTGKAGGTKSPAPAADTGRNTESKTNAKTAPQVSATSATVRPDNPTLTPVAPRRTSAAAP